ncbi:MAG TPA: hypothetical protein DCS66_18600, partial [Flavobacteriaceae bacterium]|nr:hypothetical protein [Flavobacteriaceae bacterium]
MKKIKVLISRVIIKLSKKRLIHFTVNPQVKTVFLMGMFRSGTSLTCQILLKNGLNLGPKWRL